MLINKWKQSTLHTWNPPAGLRHADFWTNDGGGRLMTPPFLDSAPRVKTAPWSETKQQPALSWSQHGRD